MNSAEIKVKIEDKMREYSSRQDAWKKEESAILALKHEIADLGIALQIVEAHEAEIASPHHKE